MSVTYPIKTRKKLEEMKNYYAMVKPNPRNYTLIVIGLNTAFRIGDLLRLQWKHIYQEKNQSFRNHICMMEQKTNKMRVVPINSALQAALSSYHSKCRHTAPEDYLFASMRNKSKPISRYQAFRIIKEAAVASGMDEHISCHSLRKTFGYYAWQQGASPVLLMDLFNHSSFQITKRYLGIEQDERDALYLSINL